MPLRVDCIVHLLRCLWSFFTDDTALLWQVGITAWGVQCNVPNIPGVYASIPDGLCFIDFATKCLEGDKYSSNYNIRECDGEFCPNSADLPPNPALFLIP